MSFWAGVRSVFDLAGRRGVHRRSRVQRSDRAALRTDWQLALGGLAGAPHTWNRRTKLWRCSGCGQSHPDPCACPCCSAWRELQ